MILTMILLFPFLVYSSIAYNYEICDFFKFIFAEAYAAECSKCHNKHYNLYSGFFYFEKKGQETRVLLF